MTSKIKNMIQCVAVLAIIALCSGLLLGAFNILTYVDPFQAALDGFKEDSGAQGEFTMVVAEKPVQYERGKIIYYAVSDDAEPVHAFLTSGAGGYGGDVQLYIYIRENKIYKIVVGENQETLWNKFKEEFYEQFYGKEITQFVNVADSDLSVQPTPAKTLDAILNSLRATANYYQENISGGTRS